jgi:hypothetical protein
MQRNPRERSGKPPASVTTTYSYAAVEVALARIYGAEAARRTTTTFRARLKHFRKLGVPVTNPGRGTRLQYTASDVFQLLVCLELSEFGFDPNLIVKLVKGSWAQQRGFFAAIFQAQLAPQADCLAVIRANVMSANWAQKIESDTKISVTSPPNALEVQFVWADKANLIEALQEPRERFCVFNLSERVRALGKFLTASSGK